MVSRPSRAGSCALRGAFGSVHREGTIASLVVNWGFSFLRVYHVDAVLVSGLSEWPLLAVSGP